MGKLICSAQAGDPWRAFCMEKFKTKTPWIIATAALVIAGVIYLWGFQAIAAVVRHFLTPYLITLPNQCTSYAIDAVVALDNTLYLATLAIVLLFAVLAIYFAWRSRLHI